MIRKLIKHGESSLTVSLPKKWVEQNNLKKGDEVNVEAKKDKVEIAATKRPSESKITIDISEKGKAIRKILGAAYKSGYDEVRINYSTASELKEIQNALSEQFVGFQMLSQSSDSLLIRNISKHSFEEFDNVMHRFFQIVNTMGDDLFKGIAESDSELLKKNGLWKKETDKLADYLRRAINLGFYSDDYKRPAPLYTVVEQYEKLANTYSELSSFAAENDAKSFVQCKNIVKKLIELQKSFSASFFSFSMENINDLIDKKDYVAGMVDDLIKKRPDADMMRFLLHIDRIISIIICLNGPLMAVNL